MQVLENVLTGMTVQKIYLAEEIKDQNPTQSAFYGGYFLIALPAAYIIRKNTYKTAIMTGLTFFIIGCAMFFPASHMATYGMFLAAIFVIAIGLSFLETSCDTYSTMMGPQESANRLINIS